MENKNADLEVVFWPPMFLKIFSHVTDMSDVLFYVNFSFNKPTHKNGNMYNFELKKSTYQKMINLSRPKLGNKIKSNIQNYFQVRFPSTIYTLIVNITCCNDCHCNDVPCLKIPVIL